MFSLNQAKLLYSLCVTPACSNVLFVDTFLHIPTQSCMKISHTGTSMHVSHNELSATHHNTGGYFIWHPRCSALMQQVDVSQLILILAAHEIIYTQNEDNVRYRLRADWVWLTQCPIFIRKLAEAAEKRRQFCGENYVFYRIAIWACFRQRLCVISKR